MPPTPAPAERIAAELDPILAEILKRELGPMLDDAIQTVAASTVDGCIVALEALARTETGHGLAALDRGIELLRELRATFAHVEG